MGCASKERKIEHALEHEGYPPAKAEHIAHALVYGPHQTLHPKRR